MKCLIYFKPQQKNLRVHEEKVTWDHVIFVNEKAMVGDDVIDFVIYFVEME